MLLTPVSELDAVNEIISAIGEAPVNTLDEVNNVDVINAIRILRGVNRRIQSKAWSFNTIDSYTLNPDVFTKRIAWSDNFLFIKGTDGTKYTKRGEYVLNFDTQSEIFDAAITVEAVLLVPFEDMPEAARNYITAKASKQFQTRYLGDAALTEELARDEMAAWQELQEYELDLNNYNVLQFTGVQQLLQR